MKIAFYAPLKPMSHPNPSGDRAIARDLFRYFEAMKNDVNVTDEFRTRWFWRELGGWGDWIKALQRSIEFVKRKRPDIFFTYHMYYKAPDPIQPLLSLLFGKPYVIYEASLAPKARKKWKTLPGYLWTRFALWQASRIYTNMREDFELLSQYYPNKVCHIPPSIDLNRFVRNELKAKAAVQKYGLNAETEVRVICAAMMRDERKTEGVSILVRSMNAILEKHPGKKIELIVAGDGKNRSRVESLVSEANREKVRFLGAVPREEMVALYSASHLFAFPGIDEGFGLVYLEAQACGLPVLAMRNGGVPDAVAEGESAVLTPVYNEIRYGEALQDLIENKDLRMKLGSNARMYVEKFHNRAKNYEVFATEMQALIQ